MADPQVIACDWYYTVNEKAHHTDVYESDDLVLRRGQPFKLTLILNRPLQPEENIFFTIETGPSPSETSKTKVVFPLFRAEIQQSWGAILTGLKSTSITVTINSHPDAVIGRYFLSVAILGRGSSKQPPQSIGAFNLLFNPWLQGDAVFMAEEDQRQEYVINEQGVIFQGSDEDITSINWEYNQFEKDILDICLIILDRSSSYKRDPALDVSKRNDPLYVCRVLSAMLNSKDDDGVLEENWSDDYKNGVSPFSWNGSINILKSWYYSKFKPVKYGQCWVYAGVLCTVLRSLGIPTRVVTHFNSGQDKNGNLFIDLQYKSQGSRQNDQEDQLWNFHVWNEAYFKRRDVGKLYNGWQVIDSTPLKRSDGMYQCGPAPLTAIKEGDINLNYDVKYMFASVNADVACWIHYINGTKKQVSNNRKETGKFISTKAVGSNDRMDVTHNYKYATGSEKEIQIFEKALKLTIAPFMGRTREKPQGEKILSGRCTVDQTSTFGQDINFILNLKNLTTKSIKVSVYINASAILYTGRHRHTIWTDEKSLILDPDLEKRFSVPITYGQYGKLLIDNGVIRMTALCVVEGTEERILVERNVSLVMPPVSMTLPEKATINQEFNANIVIANPLSETMNSCILWVEGYGLTDKILQKEVPSLKPGQSSDNNFVITPTKTGVRTLLVNFSCDKIQSMKGSSKILITDSQEVFGSPVPT
ncbi:protein-glutamine gamma-glutamyltransferase E [Xenopus laevis]|uniref:Protein-glutamine gamma-glutamyltransferase E n=2 Tax=Xenopus laevis TaxID=8355 RepID=A0A1L8ETY7_XENLA|nr:protein-glutamine gamma-glutamyltransferase E [Xenopus laevis]OCT62791.1 hypothetical protein XELAEV_18043882mg [Xenopus laevis]